MFFIITLYEYWAIHVGSNILNTREILNIQFTCILKTTRYICTPPRWVICLSQWIISRYISDCIRTVSNNDITCYITCKEHSNIYCCFWVRILRSRQICDLNKYSSLPEDLVCLTYFWYIYLIFRYLWPRWGQLWGTVHILHIASVNTYICYA